VRNELLTITEKLEIANFPEASRAIVKGPYDLSLVEGSITTPLDAERIHKVRQASKFLVAIGACATAGGIQALRNFKDVKEFISIVYASPQYIETLNKSTPISDHVFVDFELRGCPINKYQLLELVNAFLNKRKPVIPSYSVCLECKRMGNICVMVASRHALFRAGDTRWMWSDLPFISSRMLWMLWSQGIGQYASLAEWLKTLNVGEDDLVRAFRGFNAYADPFRKESEAHEK
jgi:sulfhydrogenase subunit delta